MPKVTYRNLLVVRRTVFNNGVYLKPHLERHPRVQAVRREVRTGAGGKPCQYLVPQQFRKGDLVASTLPAWEHHTRLRLPEEG